jgi:hypothetical protein
MNKKTLLGLSAIFLLLIGTLAYPVSTGQSSLFDNHGAAALRADGDPMPPPPPYPKPPQQG